MAPRVSGPVLVGRDAEAGVGKTRLVNELLKRVRARGTLALAGGCLDVGEGVVAYAPLVEAMRSLGGAVDPAELERVLGGARAELARLVPEFGVPVEVGTERGAGSSLGTSALAPGRLFELVLVVLHRLAERGPLVVVVEDLHWADQSTRDLVGFLVRNLRGGVALVLTYRSDELHRRHPLRPFLAELDRSGRAERLELGRLDRRDLGRLLAGILGEPAPRALVGEILARSEGNPFFAEELLAAHREGAEGAELPGALKDLLLARVEALPEAAQGVLQVAAVAGRRVDHQLLAEVAAQPPERLVQPLREAVAQHVLVAEDDGHAYAFRHALVQEAVYDDLLPVQRGPLHAAYARALAARADQDGDGRGAAAATLGRLAYHWHAAHDLGRALLASVAAGRAAEASFALAEAVRHYERALELWEQAPEAAARSPLDRGSLLQRTAQAASLAGEGGRAVALVRQALAETDATDEPLRAGALLERLARYHWIGGDTVAARADGYQIITRMMPDMGYHFLDPAVEGFDVTKPPILVYLRHGRDWQLGELEWVFTERPATPPLPGATYGSFGAACHYRDGTFVFAGSQDDCARRGPETGARFNSWHPDLVTLHVWLWYHNPDGLYSGTNPLVRPFNRG